MDGNGGATTGEQIPLALDCGVAVRILTQALEAQGMHVYRSFDLRNALTSLSDCTCPRHGTKQCTCQYAVLLVYGTAPSPVQLVAHGHDGQTWLTMLPFPYPSVIQTQVRELLDTFSRQNSGQAG